MENKIVKWTESKTPSEIEMELFPDNDWSVFDKHYEGTILSTHLGIWSSFHIVQCTDGIIRRVGINEIISIK